ncbi:AAA family ATPase [Nocardia sp. NPDC049220]|uniref:AAA family ATPase n=1 Tax=Nocardia sp. NPDC049220 TaxID=3155273 RepID=UPI0033F5A4A2
MFTEGRRSPLRADRADRHAHHARRTAGFRRSSRFRRTRASTRQLDSAVRYLLGHGASVRAIGDDQQLASVAAGGVIRDIAYTAGALSLNQVMRFTACSQSRAARRRSNRDRPLPRPRPRPHRHDRRCHRGRLLRVGRGHCRRP